MSAEKQHGGSLYRSSSSPFILLYSLLFFFILFYSFLFSFILLYSFRHTFSACKDTKNFRHDELSAIFSNHYRRILSCLRMVESVHSFFHQTAGFLQCDAGLHGFGKGESPFVDYLVHGRFCGHRAEVGVLIGVRDGGMFRCVCHIVVGQSCFHNGGRGLLLYGAGFFSLHENAEGKYNN